MKILTRILALFLIMPVVELALLVQVDKLIGFWPTIGIILLTGILGSLLAKREGLSVWRQFNDRLNSGGLPGRELLDGVIILCAGALLITPGVITDFVGFAGLFPVTRKLIRKAIMKRVQRATERGQMEVHFGSFGAAEMYDPAYDPHGDAAYDPNGHPNGLRNGTPETEGDYEARWGGEAREMPRHSDDFGEPRPRREDG